MMTMGVGLAVAMRRMRKSFGVSWTETRVVVKLDVDLCYWLEISAG
jgi:hypothetical protein